MTAPDAPYAPAPVPPIAKAPVSVLAIVGAIVAVLMVIGLLTVKTLVPIFDSKSFEGQVEAIATAFGVIELLSILPIALSVVFGHVGMRATSKGKRGRALAITSVALGYVLIAFYLNRVLIALIALSTFPGGGTFVQNNFFWA
ncbi:MAG TPA: hypothetical protein VIJ11_10485 [Galbitalea sp.]